MIENESLKSVNKSLLRVQEFDVEQLPREAELGDITKLSRSSIEPAKRLISLFKRLSTTALEDFPDDSFTRNTASM